MKKGKERGIDVRGVCSSTFLYELRFGSGGQTLEFEITRVSGTTEMKNSVSYRSEVGERENERTYGPALIPFKPKNTAVPTPGIKFKGNVIKYLTNPSADNFLTGFNRLFPKLTPPEPREILRPFSTSWV